MTELWHVLAGDEPRSQHADKTTAMRSLAELLNDRAVTLPEGKERAAMLTQREQVLRGERDDAFVLTDGGWLSFYARPLLAAHVTSAGEPDRRFGPIYYEHLAKNWPSTLRHRARTFGATVTVQPYDMHREHEPGQLPLDGDALAKMIQQEPSPAPFPDLHDRLQATYGYERASRAWKRACDVLTAMETEETEEVRDGQA